MRQGKQAITTFDLVTLDLDIGIYKWYMTHHLVMMHVSMKFHEIIFVPFISCGPNKKKGMFDLY